MAMLALKHRWRERGPVKHGKMQVDTPKWMKNHPAYGGSALENNQSMKGKRE